MRLHFTFNRHEYAFIWGEEDSTPTYERHFNNDDDFYGFLSEHSTLKIL